MGISKVVVVGGSAGGVEAVLLLGRSLPPDLNAAVFVCIHVSSSVPSALPELIGRGSKLATSHPGDGEAIEVRHIYVAPPDHHMLIEDGRIRLVRGAYENGHRPAIDPLFRTAAQAYGDRVIGVILSGNLDDGTAGLREVRRLGGFAIVQDPADAIFSGMPSNALENAGADEVLPIHQIASAIAAQVEKDPPVSQADEVTMSGEVNERERGRPSEFGCPHCGGVLWEDQSGGPKHYRCRVGHAYSEESLLEAQTDVVDKAMWSALRALEEAATQARRLAQRMSERGHERIARRFEIRASDAEERASTIRRALLHVAPGDQTKRAG